MVEKFNIDFNGTTLSMEVGKVAKQASAAVWMTMGETTVLSTVVMAPEAKEGMDFFPLTVEYVEKRYAAGKIPGGFIKREGRLSEREILTCRLIDRPIRPLFPDGFRNEVQVINTVLSYDGENEPSLLATIGTSAALHISEIPFLNPIASVKVGRIQGDYVLNPNKEQLEESDIELVVSGSENAICMIEAGSKFVSEKCLLEAIKFGHEKMQPILKLQEEMRAKIGKEKYTFEPYKIDENFEKEVRAFVFDKMRAVFPVKMKEDFGKISEYKKEAIEHFTKDVENQDEIKRIKSDISTLVHDYDKEICRSMAFNESMRIDGRGFEDIRKLDVEVGVLPRVHGSALFTRGQTQSLGIITLGGAKAEQIVDGIEEEVRESFYLHYNFPPFSTGETKFLRGPSRRDIGHGNLATRAIHPTLPEFDEFPYTIRIVSEILESNGSSSMATVCSASLSLMQGGVPIKEPVAGIALGLMKEDEKVCILSDILGHEDHMGDMDFKVAGSREGVTALQMDIKIAGLSYEILENALAQAKRARNKILDKMTSVIPEPNQEMAPSAPRIKTIMIPEEKTGAIIGKGGAVIKKIIEETGCDIDIQEGGRIVVMSPDLDSLQRVEEIVGDLTASPEVGKIYNAKVVRTTDFGAFCEIIPGIDGLCHISQLDVNRVAKTTDVVKEGDIIKVKLLEIDDKGRLKLSRKVLL